MIVHDTHGSYSKPLTKYDTLKRPVAKITHINHDKRTFEPIVLRKEWNNAIERPQKRVLQKIKDNQVLCRLSVKPKEKCQLLVKF